MNSEYQKAKRMAADLTGTWIDQMESRMCSEVTELLGVIKAMLFDQGVTNDDLWERTELIQEEWEAVFKGKVGFSMIGLVKEFRLRLAKALLISTEAKVTIIAKVLGYKRWNTLSKAFKARYGVTASELKERVKRDMAETRELADRLAILHHSAAIWCVSSGETEMGYRKVMQARSCYVQAEPLDDGLRAKQKNLDRELFHDPHSDVLRTLCAECRRELEGPEGESVRRGFSRCLGWIPRDLPWLRNCCDPCFEVARGVIQNGRAGLLDDGWRGTWLRNHALSGSCWRPSLGRFIGMIREIEDRVHRNDLRGGLETSELALAEAGQLEVVSLSALAHVWRGGIEAHLGNHVQSREDLVDKGADDIPWLKALRLSHSGLLRYHTRDYGEALKEWRAAVAIYERIDRHMVARNLIQQGAAVFHMGDAVESLNLFGRAEGLIDTRRDPQLRLVVIPMNRCKALSVLGRLDEAGEWLRSSRHRDWPERRDYEASFFVNRGCMGILRGDFEVAIRDLGLAIGIYREIDRPLDLGTALCYEAEVCLWLGRVKQGIGSLRQVLSIFCSIGCRPEVLARLRSVVDSLQGGFELSRVVVVIREIGRVHGGWLPVEVNREP